MNQTMEKPVHTAKTSVSKIKSTGAEVNVNITKASKDKSNLVIELSNIGIDEIRYLDYILWDFYKKEEMRARIVESKSGKSDLHKIAHIEKIYKKMREQLFINYDWLLFEE